MRSVNGALVLALFSASAIGAEPPQQEKGLDWTWSFHETSKDLPPPEDTSVVKHLPGSTKSYTQAQIDDRFNPPDCFPDKQAPMPPVVPTRSGNSCAGMRAMPSRVRAWSSRIGKSHGTVY